MEDSVFKWLRKKLSANGPALIVAVIAVVVALCGGAFAASGALTAKQKKEVKAIAKTEAKKSAAVGAAGSSGPAGPPGAKGDKGDQGEKGLEGQKGVGGKNVTTTPITAGASECQERGGALIEPSGIEVCNGKEGKEGSPWTAGGTLPPGATETGSWGFNGTSADEVTGIFVPISFPILLSKPIDPQNIHFGHAQEKPFSNFCEGSPQAPKAKPGELCIYEAVTVNATLIEIFSPATEEPSTAQSGAMMQFAPSGNAFGFGTFAVAGPEP